MDLFGWAKHHLKERASPVAWEDLPAWIARAAAQPELSLYVSLRWYGSAAGRDAYLAGADGRDTLPYRYWWWLDLDDQDPRRAVREGIALWRWELSEGRGLIAATDFVALLSGRKGLKFAGLLLTPPGIGWVEAFTAWSQELRPAYGDVVDVGMAGQHVARAPGSRHPSAAAWQVAVTEASRSAHVVDLMDMVRRAPTAGEARRWYPDPWGAPTAASAALWDHVLDLGTLARLPRQPGPARGRRMEMPVADLTEALERSGLLRRRIERNGRTVWRLKHCPACGATEGQPFVGPSGRLHCFRTSCAATGPGLPARRGAGPARVTLPRRIASASTTGPVHRPRPDAVALDEEGARLALHDTVVAALDADAPRRAVLVVRSTPGSGKTEALLREIGARHVPGRKADNARVLIGTESHELAAELSSRLRRALPWSMAEHIAHLAGRGEGNCHFPDEVGALGGRGWAPGRYFCPRCPLRDGCGYYQALAASRDRTYVVTTWEQAFALLQDAHYGAFDHVLFDEDPARALLREVLVRPSDLVTLEAGGLGERALRAAARLLQELLATAASTMRPTDHSGRPWYLMGERLHALLDVVGRRLANDNRLEGFPSATEVLLEAAAAADRIVLPHGFFAPAAGNNPAERLKAIASFPPHHLLEGFDALARDHRTWEINGRRDFVGRADLSGSATHPATLRLHIVVRPPRLPDVVLDAYADRRLYEAALHHTVDVVDVRQDAPTTAWLRVPVATSKRAFADARRAPDAWGALDEVLGLLYAAGHRADRILVVTHKALVSDVLARHQDVALRWFWQGRGVDIYAGYTAAIAFGEPEVPPESVRRTAQALFAGQEPFDLSPSDDHVRLFRDPRLQAVVDARREAELAQVLHRVRPVLPPDPDLGVPRKVIVSLGRLDSHLLPVPIDLPADAVGLTTDHVRILRLHGATALELSSHLDGTWKITSDGRGRSRSRTEWWKARARAALDAAAAILGATPVEGWVTQATDAGAPHGRPSPWTAVALPGVTAPPEAFVTALRAAWLARRLDQHRQVNDAVHHVLLPGTPARAAGLAPQAEEESEEAATTDPSIPT